MKNLLKKIFKFCIIAGILLALLVLVLDLTVVFSSRPYMYSGSDISSASDLSSLEGEDIDAIIVLGCGVIGDTPTALLSDRLDAAIELYKNAKVTEERTTTKYPSCVGILSTGGSLLKISSWIMRAFPHMRPCIVPDIYSELIRQ